MFECCCLIDTDRFASALEEGFQALSLMPLLFGSDFGAEHSARSRNRFAPVFWMDFDSRSVTPTSCNQEGPSGRDSRGNSLGGEQSACRKSVTLYRQNKHFRDFCDTLHCLQFTVSLPSVAVVLVSYNSFYELCGYPKLKARTPKDIILLKGLI